MDTRLQDWVSVSEISNRSHSGCRKNPNYVYVAMYKGSKSVGGQKAMAMVFLIGNNVMKKARMQTGDKIDVLISPDKTYAYIIRNNSGSYTIHKPSGGKNTSKIAMTWRKDVMPLIVGTSECSSVVVDDKGILIEFPKL